MSTECCVHLCCWEEVEKLPLLFGQLKFLTCLWFWHCASNLKGGEGCWGIHKQLPRAMCGLYTLLRQPAITYNVHMYCICIAECACGSRLKSVLRFKWSHLTFRIAVHVLPHVMTVGSREGCGRFAVFRSNNNVTSNSTPHVCVEVQEFNDSTWSHFLFINIRLNDFLWLLIKHPLREVSQTAVYG